MKFVYSFFLAFAVFLLSSCSDDSIVIRTNSLTMHIDSHGVVQSLLDENGTDYSLIDSVSYFLSIKSDDRLLYPDRVTKSNNQLKFDFDDPGVRVSVATTEKESYMRFEVVSVSDPDKIDLEIWGPSLPRITETIGETVGVVRDDNYAIGIQSLNPRTLGGYPWNDNDAMPEIDIFENGDYSDLSEEGRILAQMNSSKKSTAA